MLKVMIVDSELKRSKPLKQSLIDNGFEVVAHVDNDLHLQDVETKSTINMRKKEIINSAINAHITLSVPIIVTI